MTSILVQQVEMPEEKKQRQQRLTSPRVFFGSRLPDRDTGWLSGVVAGVWIIDYRMNLVDWMNSINLINLIKLIGLTQLVRLIWIIAAI
jgi:hypothetical protein